jgi:drug/metabolite transporter (DMT)-like permease
MEQAARAKRRRGEIWIAGAPALFVVLWSTGFIGGKLGLPYAEPFTFLVLRFGIAAVLMTTAAVVARAKWPKSWSEAGHIAIFGVFIHGVYIGGVFCALARGVPAGVAALIVGVQPLLTALAAGSYLGERITRTQWSGLAIGFAGVALVVWDKVQLDASRMTGVAFAVAALLGITFGTLYQKRHAGGMDLRTGSAIQFAAATVSLAVPAMLFETMTITWSGEFIFALCWLIVVLSFGAITLLLILIRRGAAAKVASLFYLVPPVTAVFAFFLFNETLGIAAIGGMALAVGGVALVTRS